ncbi:hypothetical protein PsorP6_010646 [Peronosclerospora sorghi]|uniref:Uncharacterized protein n=1 Tax=Peronosclerospora sorghi TaxID=230839 RepID=A0ACC0VV33_9STRA|nr:hypothetical protein PsorP6_010646 [Peronosclerospora sorghi]
MAHDRPLKALAQLRPAPEAQAKVQCSLISTSKHSLNACFSAWTRFLVYLHRANIGHDISPSDDNLIVLFRRNSKEVASKPARWTTDHCAVWNQHVEIQTSLLRPKTPHVGAEFAKKEYEIVLVAVRAASVLKPTPPTAHEPLLPSHSAVALFSIDFATLVHLNASAPERRHAFHLPPLKCRDLAASLDFEITWDVGRTSTTSVPLSVAPRTSQTPQTASFRSRRTQTETASGRRTATSVSSGGSSEQDVTGDDLATSSCPTCRAAKRKVDRKEVQVLQLESFLKESQKRIDALVAENEELLVREKAETSNAAHHCALSLRLLQELETTVHDLCTNPMQGADPTSQLVAPQLALIEKVKQFHLELNPQSPETKSRTPRLPASTFDFRAEMDAALVRNQRLQEQLEFLGRSLEYDSEVVGGRNRTQRSTTDASVTSVSSVQSARNRVDAKQERAVALTMTQQLNNLERENFKLRAELEGALATAASALKTQHPSPLSSGLTSGMSLTTEVSETTSCSSREDMEEPESEDTALLTQIREQHELEAGRSAALESELEDAKREIERLKAQLDAGPTTAGAEPDLASDGLLDKIYADVGKAKAMLEDRVHELEKMVDDAKGETSQVRREFETKVATSDSEVQSVRMELQRTVQQLQDANVTHAELVHELETVRAAYQQAQERVAQLETLKSASPPPTTLDVSDVQKQLKLAKQEVMQLRFRSNQVESLQERLDIALKEKRAFEVKFTALQGQLYEERNWTENGVKLVDLQRQVDDKTTALHVAERKVDERTHVLEKVKRMETELQRLSERNGEQAKRLETFEMRISVVVKEREELEAIVQEMMHEMALLRSQDSKLGVEETKETARPQGKVAALVKNFSN